jgi:predicted deacetylase
MQELKDDNGEEEAAAGTRLVKVDDDEHILANEADLSVDQKQQQEHNGVLNKNAKKFFAIVTIHDVAPEYSDKIFKAADELKKLDIHYNLAIIPHFKRRNKNLISKNPEFVRKVLGYEQEITLHGNYHESDDGKIEDFHTFSIEEAKKHLQDAINIFKDARITTNVFIPPTWAINNPTIDDLVELGFTILETKEEILILDSEKRRRLHAGLLNWDQSGSPQKNKEYLAKNKQLYRLLVMQKNSQLIRIAIHPKDPEEALQDQIEIIQGLKDMNYNFLSYGEILRVEWRGEEEEEILFSSQRAKARRS